MKHLLRYHANAYQLKLFLFLCAVFFFQFPLFCQHLRVVVAGLNHDHVHGILKQFKEGRVDIIGIAEPDRNLQLKYAKQYQIPDSLFYDDLSKLLSIKKPEAVLGYNSAAGHVSIVRICAPLGISVMVEKPLAATLAQAQEMLALSKQYHIRVLTNFETTWYGSYYEMYRDINNDSIGKIRKMVVHDGHQGPKEIGCSEAFLSWLTDSLQNGAGALNDFGCYGADLMTWLMHGKKPFCCVRRHPSLQTPYLPESG